MSIGVRSISVGSIRSSDEELGIGFGFSFSFVQSVDLCVTTGEVVSVSVGNSGADPPGRGVGCCVRVVSGVSGVKERRIGFRLGQAKRGDGENYDLKDKQNISKCYSI